MKDPDAATIAAPIISAILGAAIVVLVLSLVAGGSVFGRGLRRY